MKYFSRNNDKMIRGILLLIAALLTATILILIPSILSEYFGEWEKTTGVISNTPDCAAIDKTELLSCTKLEITYDIDGKTYKKFDISGRITNRLLKKGEKITVQYQKNKDPYNIIFLDEYTKVQKEVSFSILLGATVILWLIAVSLP